MSSLTDKTRNGALKRNLLRQMLKASVFKFGEFQLKSGQISPIYIDLRECFGHPGLLVSFLKFKKKIIAYFNDFYLKENYFQMLISEAISKQVEISEVQYAGVLGIPYAALPYASVAAGNYLKKPLLIVRKEAKSYGTKKLIEGLYQPNDRLILIEDVVTTGGSILDVVKVLHTENLVASDVFCILDREQGGRQKLQDAGVTLHSLLDMQTVLTFLYSTGAIGDEQWHGIVQVSQIISIFYLKIK